MIDMPRSVEWRDNTLVLLDQRKLPQSEEVVICDSIEQVFHGIKTLTVRGAPAIGIAAAYGLLVGCHNKDWADIHAEFNERCDYLISARPTAVNLAWAVNRMRDREQRCLDRSSLFADLLHEAQLIHGGVQCHRRCWIASGKGPSEFADSLQRWKSRCL